MIRNLAIFEPRESLLGNSSGPAVSSARETIVSGNTVEDVLGATSGSVDPETGRAPEGSRPVRNITNLEVGRNLGLPQWEGIDLERSEPIFSSDININIDSEKLIRGIEIGEEVNLGLFDLSGDGATANQVWKFSEQAKRIQEYFINASSLDGDFDQQVNFAKLTNLAYLVELLRKSDQFFLSLKNPWSSTSRLPTSNLIIDLSYNRKSESSIYRNSRDFLNSINSRLDNPSEIWNEYCNFVYLLFAWGSPRSLGLPSVSDGINLLANLFEIQSINPIEFPKDLDSWRAINGGNDREPEEIDLPVNNTDRAKLLNIWTSGRIESRANEFAGYLGEVKKSLYTSTTIQSSLQNASARLYLFLNSILRNSKITTIQTSREINSPLRRKILETGRASIVEGFPGNILGSPFSSELPTTALKLSPIVNIDRELINLFSREEDLGREQLIETGLNENISPQEIIDWTNSFEERLGVSANLAALSSKGHDPEPLKKTISNTVQEHIFNLSRGVQVLSPSLLSVASIQNELDNLTFRRNSLIVGGNLDLAQTKSEWELSAQVWRALDAGIIQNVNVFNSISLYSRDSTTPHHARAIIRISDIEEGKFPIPNSTRNAAQLDRNHDEIALERYGIEDLRWLNPLFIDRTIERFERDFSSILDLPLRGEEYTNEDIINNQTATRAITLLRTIREDVIRANNQLTEVQRKFFNYRQSRLRNDLVDASDDEGVQDSERTIELRQIDERIDALNNSLLGARQNLIGGKESLISHWIMRQSASNSNESNTLTTAAALASFHEWSRIRMVSPEGDESIEFSDLLSGEVSRSVDSSLLEFTSEDQNIIDVQNFLQEFIQSRTGDEVVPTERLEIINFSSDGIFSRSQINPAKYISEYIVGPIFESILEEQKNNNIFRDINGLFSGGTLYGNIDQFSLWTLIYLLASIEIRRIESESRNSNIQQDNRSFDVPLFFFIKDRTSPDAFLKFYFNKQDILRFVSSYGLGSSEVYLSQIDNNELGYLDTIPMFHTHIKNNVVSYSRNFTQRIEEAANIANSQDLNLGQIQSRAQVLRSVWDRVGDIKLLRSRTQLLQSIYEGNVERSLGRGPSALIYDSSTNSRVTNRSYLTMLDLLLKNFDFIKSTFENNSIEDFRDGDKIVLSGSPIISGFWSRSPISQLSLNYKSLINNLSFTYDYILDQGLWASPKSPDYRYEILPRKSRELDFFFGDPPVREPLDTIKDFSDKYWNLYRFENGTMKTISYQEASNYYISLGYSRERSEKIVNATLLSENMKIWINETIGLNLRDTDFSRNNFKELGFFEKRLVTPYDRRPFDRLFCLPWSIDLLLTIEDKRKGFLDDREDSFTDLANRNVNSDFLVGELQTIWTTSNYNGASTWTQERL